VIHTFNTKRISVKGNPSSFRWWIAIRLIWLARLIAGIEYVD